MVGINDLRINEAFISTTRGGDAEEQLTPSSPIFINVDVQAGSAAFSGGIAYRLHVILLDHTASFTNRFSQVVTGHLGPGDPWNTPDHLFTFPLPAGPGVQPAVGTSTTPGPDSLLSIEAVLTSGVSGQGVNVFDGSEVVVVP